MSVVSRQPVRCCRLGTTLDGQTDSVKKNRIRLSVGNPVAVARNDARRPDRFIQKEQNVVVEWEVGQSYFWGESISRQIFPSYLRAQNIHMTMTAADPTPRRQQ